MTLWDTLAGAQLRRLRSVEVAEPEKPAPSNLPAWSVTPGAAEFLTALGQLIARDDAARRAALGSPDLTAYHLGRVDALRDIETMFDEWRKAQSV